MMLQQFPLPTAEADLGNYAPSDFVPQQQGINEGTKNTSYDHLFAGTNPHVLVDQIKSVSEGLDTVLTQPLIGKEASSISRQVEEEEAFSTIKLQDPAKLVSNVQPSFKDLDSPENDHVIIIEESDEEENDEIHATENVETEDTSVPKSSSLNSLPTELKDIPSKLNELTGEVQGLKNQVYNLEIELLRELKEIHIKPENFTKTVTGLTSQVTEQKTLHLLSHVTKALNKFAQVLVSASSKAGDKSVPSAGQADIMPAEGEKNTNQANISQLF
ncbi:hypothetical protein Tco_0155064 [Tanacetum coccineum]